MKKDLGPAVCSDAELLMYEYEHEYEYGVYAERTTSQHRPRIQCTVFCWCSTAAVRNVYTWALDNIFWPERKNHTVSP